MHQPDGVKTMRENASPDTNAQNPTNASNDSSNMSCGGSCSDKEEAMQQNIRVPAIVPPASTERKQTGRKRKRPGLVEPKLETPKSEKPERKITEYINSKVSVY